MIKKIKTLILSLSLVFAFAAPVLVVGSASAADIQNSLCSGASSLQVSTSPNPSTSCQSSTGEGVSKFNTLLTDIINVFSVIVGIVAVIMIIYAGFRYITSGGASDKVGNAKNTILYALIGLVIVALAQLIVKFVLNKATGV
jgi:cytochrome bd-type quinol oxidase subunit 2